MNQSNPIPTTSDYLKQDVRNLADHAVKATQSNVIAPAMDAARSAGAYASDALDKTKEQIGQQVTHAREFTSESMDRTARWVTANPLTGLGVGFVAGIMAASFLVSSKR